MESIVPELRSSSLRDAATQLRNAARATGVALYPLPYSRFDPSDTTWWLSPTKANPAYAFGKIVVEQPTIVDDGASLIGLHVEKGVGETAAAIFEETARGRRLVLRRDWFWHGFERGLRSGDVAATLRDAEAAADGLPVVVEIVASLVWPPKLEDVDDRPVDHDSVERLRYRSSGGSLTLAARHTAARLDPFAEHETLASIAEKIAGISDLDWTWVEVLAGVPFRRVSSGGLAAGEVWQRACATWMPWVR